MPTLSVDLHDGFAGERVSVTVGERVILDAPLRTDYAIGRAGGAKVEVPAGTTTVDVRVPARALSLRRAFDVSRDVYLAVSIVGGALTCRESAVPFEYL